MSGLARRQERMSSVQAGASKETKCPFGRTLRQTVRGLPGHVLSIFARSRKGFHPVTYGQSDDCAAGGFLISEYLGHAGTTLYQSA